MISPPMSRRCRGGNHAPRSSEALGDGGGDFASRLDAAITRTNKMKQIKATPAKAELPLARAQPKDIGKVYSVEHVSKSRATVEGPRNVRNGQRFFIAMGGSYEKSQSSTS
jgi:hypothetical protein